MTALLFVSHVPNWEPSAEQTSWPGAVQEVLDVALPPVDGVDGVDATGAGDARMVATGATAEGAAAEGTTGAAEGATGAAEGAVDGEVAPLPPAAALTAPHEPTGGPSSPVPAF